MDLKTATKGILKRIFFIYPLCLISLYTVFFFLNYLLDNKLMETFLKLEILIEEHRYPCDLKELPPVIDGVMKINDITFNDGTGTCFKNKLNNVKRIEIKTSRGGNVNSARIMANEINKNKIDVMIKGYCLSACVDLLLHANNRIVCKNAPIGIHQFSPESGVHASYLMKEYMLLKQKSMVDTIPDQSINHDFLEKTMNKVGGVDLHILTLKELTENNIATEIKQCY